MSSDSVTEVELLAALRDWGNGSTRRQFLRKSGLLVGSIATAGIVADMIAACASGTTNSNGSVVKGGHVVYGDPSDVHELLPQQRPSLNAEWIVQTMMFDGLVAIGPNGDLIPKLAESLGTFSSDGLTATFKMKKNAKWTDGKPVTAQDVVFSYNLDIDPQYDAWNAPSRSTNAAFIKQIEAVDDYTVKFTAKQLDSNFALIGSRMVAPKHVLGQLTGAQLNTDAFVTAPSVTSGPFKFDHWDKGSQVVLAANSDYYGGAPNVKNWVYKQLSANQNVADLLSTGEVDWASVPLTAYDHLATVSSVTLTTFKGHNDIDNILFNLDPKKPYFKLFGDKAVRQALAYALDREAMLKAVFFGHGIVPNGIVLHGSWAYNDNVTPKYTYDKAKAESLLDGAGWTKDSSGKRSKNGVKLAWDLHGYNLPEFTNAAQICQQAWNAVGCEVTLKLGTVNATVDELLNSRNWPMMIIDFGPNTVVPDIRIYVDSKGAGPGGINGEQIISPELDQLMAKAAATLDRTKAKPIWDQIQNLMAEQCWIISLMSHDAVWAVNKRVKGTQFSIYNSWDVGLPWINQVWVTDGK